ncbi:MAG: hypothetical protein WC496_03280 [Phycisphaerae bacterium]|jgi:hypothetical protein
MNNKTLLMLLSVCFVLVSGCDNSNTGMNIQEQKALPAPTPLPQITPNIAARLYPCQGCSVVRLDKIMPAQVQAGAEFEYKIRVTNLSDDILSDVVVTDTLIRNFKHKSSNPPANIDGDKLIWTLPEFAPRETKEIKGVAIASTGGIVQTYSDVAYRMPIRTQTISLQPKIALSMSAPAEMPVCKPIIYIFKVANTGTGTANNLRIVDNLPEGLVTAQGKTNIDIPIGVLPARTSKSISVMVNALKSGIYTNTAVAIADNDVTVESPTITTTVTTPMLAITNTGPETHSINKEITYEISVTNTGDGTAADIIIENPIPAGLNFIRASRGGMLSGNKVMWRVARLNQGDTVKTFVTYMTNSTGTFVNTASASAVCADAVIATTQTFVKGEAGILLEVGDLTDPIKIGNTVTYRIVATNQGAVPLTNISIKAMLEPQMGYVGSVGVTQGQFSDNGTITFETLAGLAPGTQAIWEVTVRATAAGDIRFKAEMAADQLDRVVSETESTHFYE